MFIHLFIFYLFIIPTIVYSHCYSRLSQTWICNGNYKINNFTYENILNNQQFENFFLINYQLKIFQIDNYPLTLRLLNASGNYFQSIIITSKNREKSNIRQLILESNHLEQFNIDTIILPNSLEKISLANNKLKILDARIFSYLKNLIEIDLRNNQLKRILPQLLLNKNILLDNNPLNCQCTSESYRILCEKATTIKQRTVSSKLIDLLIHNYFI
jgi:Leucine-rich repeat (LRR) protein